MANYYDILGVTKNATPDEIKKAYRELSKKYHPDRNGGDDTKFKEINEAYSTLTDASKKREYDMRMNGFGGFNGFRFSRQMASDLNVMFTITLEEAYNGCSKNTNLNGKILSVDIPKGTGNGQVLRIPGMGIKGVNIYGQEAVGDLIVRVKILNTDKMWINDKGILETMYAIDWIDAILGTEITVEVFDRKETIRVPKYTQNGGYTMAGGKGFRKFKSDELGSLKVNFIIKMPKSLSDEQIEKLKTIKEGL